MVLFQIVYMLIFKESVTFNLYKYVYLQFNTGNNYHPVIGKLCCVNKNQKA